MDIPKGERSVLRRAILGFALIFAAAALMLLLASSSAADEIPEGYVITEEPAGAVHGKVTLVHGDHVFADQTAVVIPAVLTGPGGLLYDVTVVEALSFMNDGTVQTVSIPASVTNIGIGAFFKCASLREINVDPGNPSYMSDGGVLLSKDGKDLLRYPQSKEGASYNVPNGVQTVKIGSFDGCANLASVILSNTVTAIEGDAFSGCRLTSFTVGTGMNTAFVLDFAKAKLSFSDNLAQSLSGSAYTVSVTDVDVATLPSDQQSLVGSYKVFNIDVGGRASLSYPLGVTVIDAVTSENIVRFAAVYYLPTVGEYSKVSSDHIDGHKIVSFETSNPGNYSVIVNSGEMIPYSKNVAMFIAAGATAIAIIVGLSQALRKRDDEDCTVMNLKGNGPVMEFRRSVMLRSQKDLIVNWFATLLIILVPAIAVLTMLILMDGDMGTATTQFKMLKTYEDTVITIPVVLEFFVLMVVMRKMYTRLADHSNRDLEWRRALIRYTKQVGGDNERLKEIDQRIRKKEHFRSKGVTDVLLALMFIFIAAAFLYALPGKYTLLAPDLPVMAATMIVGAFLLLLMAVFIWIPLMRFPFLHEKRQVEFTEELQKALGQRGIKIVPMAKTVRAAHIYLDIILLMITGGVFLIFLLIRLFKAMNDHLKNEWLYEEELLKAVESDGERGFKKGAYVVPEYAGWTARQERQSRKHHSRDVRKEARFKSKMPKSLILAELFLIVICVTYVFKLTGLVCDMSVDYSIYEDTFNKIITLHDWNTFKEIKFSVILKVVIILMDVLFLSTTINSLLGIASRRASSWRKVTRSCVTFAIPTILSAFVTTSTSYTHLFDFNPYLTVAILYAVLLMMIVTYKIRKFYAPVGIRMPGLAKWIGYLFFGSLEPKFRESEELEASPDEIS